MVNLCPAIHNSTVHAHGLVDEAQGAATVEAILGAMVDAVGLLNARVLHCPSLLTCNDRKKLL